MLLPELASRLFVLLLALWRLPRLRLATVEDAPRLQSLMLDVEGEHVSEAMTTADWWQAQLLLPQKRWLILEARQTHEALGLVSVASRAASHDLPNRKHIALLAVRKDCRRHGHGTRMLCSALAALDASGARCTSLFVRPSNAPALRLYEKLGFRRFSLISDYYSGSAPEDGLLCVRWLQDREPRDGTAPGDAFGKLRSSHESHAPTQQPAQRPTQQQPTEQPAQVGVQVSGRLRGGAASSAFPAPSATSALRRWARERVQQARRADSRPPLDGPTDQAYLASWRQSAGGHASATRLFSEASEMDDGMNVEVHQRKEGWRTLSLVGPRRSIMHGVVKTDELTGSVEPSAVPTEYIKSQVALALAGLEPSVVASESGASAKGGDHVPSRPLRFLFLGGGAFVSPRLVRAHVPTAELTAIELDDTVVRAANACLGLQECACNTIVADAVSWVAERAAQQRLCQGVAEPQGDQPEGQAGTEEPDRQQDASARLQFDAVLIDVFDEANLCPPDFYSEAFLSDIRCLLDEAGVLVHNLHFGSRKLNVTQADAENAYGEAFVARGGSGCTVRSLDSKGWAGNALIGVSRGNAFQSPGETLLRAARSARERYGLGYDASARCKGAECLAVWRARKKGTK